MENQQNALCSQEKDIHSRSNKENKKKDYGDPSHPVSDDIVMETKDANPFPISQGEAENRRMPTSFRDTLAANNHI